MPGFPRIALFALAGLVLGIRAEQRPSSHPADPGPEGLFRSVEERYLKEESLQWRALVNADMMTLTVKFETGNRFSIVEEGGEHERDLWHWRCDGSKLRLAGGWEGVAPEVLSSHIRRMLARWGSFAATEAPFKAEA